MLLEVKEVTKRYDIDGQILKAVDAVSLTADKAEMLSIVGHSGSGKTTLLSLMGGLTRPDAGTVIIDGTDLWALGDNERSGLRNRRMSFIYQFSSLIPTLNAIENIILPTAFGTFGADSEEYARELLAIVGLEDKARAYPSHLSGGQQRRVAIARAFINNPEIVMADEPTGDLDEQSEGEIIRLFHRMNREKAVTFIIVTHNREIASQATRQLRMTNGVLLDADRQ